MVEVRGLDSYTVRIEVIKGRITPQITGWLWSAAEKAVRVHVPCYFSLSFLKPSITQYAALHINWGIKYAMNNPTAKTNHATGLTWENPSLAMANHEIHPITDSIENSSTIRLTPLDRFVISIPPLLDETSRPNSPACMSASEMQVWWSDLLGLLFVLNIKLIVIFEMKN